MRSLSELPMNSNIGTWHYYVKLNQLIVKNIFFTFILLHLTFFLFSQNNSISGNILNGENQAVEFANVLLMNATDSSLVKGQLSNADGSFYFESISNGKYYINASFIGTGEGLTELINLTGNEEVSLGPINLINGLELDEISIVSKKALIELKADKMIVNVANSSISSGQSALEVIQKSPGIIVDNNQNISLKGKQGVMIMINGKKQYLNGEELARFLENMPASNIQSLEIISNPSSKYDADTNSGIINIVLKKNENFGTNGMLSTTLRQGQRFSHFHNASINYRASKVNVYANADYYSNRSYKELDIERNVLSENGVTNLNQLAEQNYNDNGFKVKLAIDYALTPKTSVGAFAKTNFGNAFEVGKSINLITGANKPLFDQLIVDNNDVEKESNQNYNVNFSHKFNDKGLELNFDTDYYAYTDNILINYINEFKDKHGESIEEPYLLRNDQKRDIKIIASKLDFSMPINAVWKMDMGTKYSRVSSQNNTNFEFLNDMDLWENQENRTNDFIYHEEVKALYAITSGKIGSYAIQAGLRLENTNTTGESVTLNKITPRKYTDLFPSLSISRTFGDKHNVSFAYSKGLQRPNYQDLNPFEYFLDQYTFNRGNPLLNPQYSHSIGINYAMGNALFVSLDYVHTSDVITEVIEQISEENKIFQTNQNLDKFNNLALTISKSKVWTEWFNSRLNYTAYYSEFSSVIPSGYLKTSNLAHFISLNNEIQLPQDWNMEVGAHVQSKIQYGLFEIFPKGSLDLGLSKSFLDRKARLNITVSDLLFTNNSNVRIDQDDIDLFLIQRKDSRRLSVNLTYSLGNQKVKAAKRRKTASAEESGRI